MIVRSLEIKDIPVIAELHQTYYKELELPDFTKGLCSFVIGDNEPVCIGMVKTYAEAIILTDKSKSLRQKREALYQVLDIGAYVAKQHGYQQLHAVTLDEHYAEILLKRGFDRVRGHNLVIDI